MKQLTFPAGAKVFRETRGRCDTARRRAAGSENWVRSRPFVTKKKQRCHRNCTVDTRLNLRIIYTIGAQRATRLCLKRAAGSRRCVEKINVCKVGAVFARRRVQSHATLGNNKFTLVSTSTRQNTGRQSGGVRTRASADFLPGGRNFEKPATVDRRRFVACLNRFCSTRDCEPVNR